MDKLSSLLAGVVIFAGSGIVMAELLPSFPNGSVWRQSVENAPVDPNSGTMIATLNGLGGFGNSRMQMSFEMHVVRAAASSPMRTIIARSGEYPLPDCGPLGSTVPVPTDAVIEAQNGLDCDNAGEDCHLLMVQGQTLYEGYKVTQASADSMQTSCLAVWNLDTVYPPEGRGDHCASADAAGFPIALLLFNADDVTASLQADPSGSVDLGHVI